MTTRSAINTDDRAIAAGLAENVAVLCPATITATGRAAPSRQRSFPAPGGAEADGI